jgi:hypothetical protein
MKLLRSVKIVLFLTALIGFGSCENYYTDDFFRNSNEKLCDRLWERTYFINNNELCTHQLVFKEELIRGNLIGTETFEYSGRRESSTFYWEWADKEREGITITHPLYGVLFFDNVWVRTHYLSGNLDGEEVTFYSKSFR